MNIYTIETNMPLGHITPCIGCKGLVQTPASWKPL